MTEPVFAADPTRLLIAAAVGIILLLLLIIRFKIHPVLSLVISALFIGLGAGMPVPMLVSTVEKGAGDTLQGIVLLIGLGSLFGGILEVSGGAQCVAQTLINKFGESKCCDPDSAGIWPGKENEEINLVLCDSAACRSGNRICIYPAVGRFRAGCEYAACRSWHYDCSRCPGWNPFPAFCRNFMVKIYWLPD